jgi:archaellum component FlaG (FlaF/FlaG flagellin family)
MGVPRLSRAAKLVCLIVLLTVCATVTIVLTTGQSHLAQAHQAGGRVRAADRRWLASQPDSCSYVRTHGRQYAAHHIRYTVCVRADPLHTESVP